MTGSDWKTVKVDLPVSAEEQERAKKGRKVVRESTIELPPGHERVRAVFLSFATGVSGNPYARGVCAAEGVAIVRISDRRIGIFNYANIPPRAAASIRAPSKSNFLSVQFSSVQLLAEPLASVQWQAVILDGGQYIRNPESQTAKVACALRAEHRLVLTGTPIENRLMDLWSLMQFAMPGALGSRVRFACQFDKAQDPLARQRLAARVRPFLLRRTKAQVAPELPERIEEDLLCEMEPAQRQIAIRRGWPSACRW